MLQELLTATTSFHVFPLDYQQGPCRFCERTYRDYQSYDRGRSAQVCTYFGATPRIQVLGLENFIPREFINRIMQAHRSLRNEMRGGAYASTATNRWAEVAAEFRLLVESLQTQRAAGLLNDPPPANVQPPASMGVPVDSSEMSMDVPISPDVINPGFAAGALRAREQAQQRRNRRNPSQGQPAPPLQPGQRQGVRPGDVADVVNNNLNATELPATPKNRKRRVSF